MGENTLARTTPWVKNRPVMLRSSKSWGGGGLAVWLWAVAFAIAAVSPGRAGVVQGVGTNYVGVEAENFDSLSGTRWTPVEKSPSTLTSAYGTAVLPSYSDASGGRAMLDFTGTTATVGFDFTFTTATNYYVYLRYSLFENNGNITNYGNEDSVFVGSNWNVIAGANWETFDVSTYGSNSVASGGWEGLYRWGQVMLRTGLSTVGRVETMILPVTETDLGNPLTLNLRTREAGFSLDYILLSPENNLSQTQLDYLAMIPEPSTIALLCAGVLLFVCRRRA